MGDALPNSVHQRHGSFGRERPVVAAAALSFCLPHSSVQQLQMSCISARRETPATASASRFTSALSAALIARCVQLYWQLDYTLLFGEFDTTRALGPYYTRQGFSVLRPGEASTSAPCSPRSHFISVPDRA